MSNGFVSDKDAQAIADAAANSKKDSQPAGTGQTAGASKPTDSTITVTPGSDDASTAIAGDENGTFCLINDDMLSTSYEKFSDPQKLAGIQMNHSPGLEPKTVLFKQDYIVIIRKKFYFASNSIAALGDEKNQIKSGVYGEGIYIRSYIVNNFYSMNISHSVDGQGKCSLQLMGAQRVTKIEHSAAERAQQTAKQQQEELKKNQEDAAKNGFQEEDQVSDKSTTSGDNSKVTANNNPVTTNNKSANAAALNSGNGNTDGATSTMKTKKTTPTVKTYEEATAAVEGMDVEPYNTPDENDDIQVLQSKVNKTYEIYNANASDPTAANGDKDQPSELADINPEGSTIIEEKSGAQINNLGDSGDESSWVFAEKADWEPNDEIFVFGKSQFQRNSSTYDIKTLDSGAISISPNSSTAFKYNQLFFGYITDISHTFSPSGGYIISIACDDQLKLLAYSWVSTMPSVTPGINNGGKIDLRFGSPLSNGEGVLGMFKYYNPAEIAATGEKSAAAAGKQSQEEAEKNLKTHLASLVALENPYGGYPAWKIITGLCQQAGVPQWYLDKRIEPIQYAPFLFKIRTNAYQAAQQGQAEKRIDLCKKVVNGLFLEFFADECGNIVLKCPNYVLGVNKLVANNMNISALEGGVLDQIHVQFFDTMLYSNNVTTASQDGSLHNVDTTESTDTTQKEPEADNTKQLETPTVHNYDEAVAAVDGMDVASGNQPMEEDDNLVLQAKVNKTYELENAKRAAAGTTSNPTTKLAENYTDKDKVLDAKVAKKQAEQKAKEERQAKKQIEKLAKQQAKQQTKQEKLAAKAAKQKTNENLADAKNTQALDNTTTDTTDTTGTISETSNITKNSKFGQSSVMVYTHTISGSDTMYSICQEYYGYYDTLMAQNIFSDNILMFRNVGVQTYEQIGGAAGKQMWLFRMRGVKHDNIPASQQAGNSSSTQGTIQSGTGADGKVDNDNTDKGNISADQQLSEDRGTNQPSSAAIESAKSNMLSQLVSDLTDSLIPEIPPQYIINMSFKESDSRIYNNIQVNIVGDWGLFETTGQVTSISSVWADVRSMLKYGVRTAPDMTFPRMGNRENALILGYMICCKSMCDRFSGSITMIEDSFIRVGNPIRFIMYDDYPEKSIIPSSQLETDYNGNSSALTVMSKAGVSLSNAYNLDDVSDALANPADTKTVNNNKGQVQGTLVNPTSSAGTIADKILSNKEKEVPTTATSTTTEEAVSNVSSISSAQNESDAISTTATETPGSQYQGTSAKEFAQTTAAQAIYYVSAISRSISVQNASTMTLTLTSGRMLGRPSNADYLMMLYKAYYYESAGFVPDIASIANLIEAYKGNTETIDCKEKGIKNFEQLCIVRGISLEPEMVNSEQNLDFGGNAVEELIKGESGPQHPHTIANEAGYTVYTSKLTGSIQVVKGQAPNGTIPNLTIYLYDWNDSHFVAEIETNGSYTYEQGKDSDSGNFKSWVKNFLLTLNKRIG